MPQLILPDLLTREQAAVLALPPQTLSISELFSMIANCRKEGKMPGATGWRSGRS